MASPASGLNYCRKLLFLSLVALWPLSLAQGQEIPTAPLPSAPTGPAGGPSRPLPQPVPGAPSPVTPPGPEGVPTQPPLQPVPGAPLPGTPVGPEGGPIQPLPIPLPPSGPAALPPYGLGGLTSEPPMRALPLGPPVETLLPFSAQTFVTIDEEFTDNADQTKHNRRSEFRTSVAPGLAARIDRPQASLDFSYTPRYFYPSRLDDSRFDQNLTLRSGWNPSPFIRLNASEDLVYANDFRFQQNPGSRATGTTSYLTNQASAGVAYVPPSGRIGLTYSNVLQRDYSAGADSSLTNNLRADGLLTNPRSTLAGSYTLTRGEFDINSSYWEHAVDSRLTRVLTPTLSGTLFGGFTYHDSDRNPTLMTGRVRLGGTGSIGPNGTFVAEGGAGVFAPQNDSTEVHPSFLLTWSQSFNVFSVSVTYLQDIQENFQALSGTGVTFTKSAGIALATTELLSRNFTASLTGQWVENNFKQTVPTAGVTAGTVDRTWNIGAEIRYFILRPLSFVIGYTATIRTSTDPTVGFLENRVHFGLTYQYQIF